MQMNDNWLWSITLKRVGIFLFMVGLSGYNNMAADTARAEQEKSPAEIRAPDSALVERMGVSAPTGRFLLVRKGIAACAVRFTSFHRDGEYKYAEYDWYYQGDGSADFSLPNVARGHNKLHDRPSIGFGHFVFKPFAALDITCGSIRVPWGYPNLIWFGAIAYSNVRDDRDLELAPTKAADIREVDIKNPKLRWYKLDEKRQGRFIPLEELP